LTDRTPGFEGPLARPSDPSGGSGCPSDVDLGRFIDGALDASAHAAMVEHLESCDDCREIVATVVAAEGVLQDAAAPAPVSAPARPAPPQPWWLWRPAVLGSAAVLAAAAILAIRLTSDAPPDRLASTDDPWAEIAAAVGRERTLEARLSRLPARVPLASPTRAANTSRPDAFRMRALAAQFAEAARNAPDGSPARTSAQHAAGVAELLSGETGEAIRTLEAAMNASTTPDLGAALLADLSAAHAAEGQWQASLDAARRSLDVQPTPAAAFNEALALERLGRSGEAAAAWRAIADDVTLDPAWRDEARRHVSPSRP
jgi:hypothetical protein